MAELNEIASILDGIIAETDISKVTSDGPGFENLPDGYYLGEVTDKTKLDLNKNNIPTVAVSFKIVEDGKKTVIDETGNSLLEDAKGTKGRFITRFYNLKDSRSYKSFVADMLKFELPAEPGKPMLDEECFTANTEVLCESLKALVGMRIYLNVQTTKNADGKEYTNSNLVKWDRVEELGL